MEEQLEQLRKRLHFCMAVLGGCFGAYAILQFGHFASAVTVNFIEVFTGAAQGNWEKSLLRLGAVAVYFFTLLLSAWLAGRSKGNLRFWAILTDMATAAILCLLPQTAQDFGTYLCIFTMGFQWFAFAGKQGYPCSTIFSTNNLRQFLDAWVQVFVYKDVSQTPRMRMYGGTLLAFHSGVIAMCILWRLGCGQWTILGSLIPASVAFVWQNKENCLRRKI